MKNPILIVILFSVSIINSFAQDSAIRFKIHQQAAATPIEFVQLSLKHHPIGTYCNEQGIAELTLNKNELESCKNDTLLISAISFEKKEIAFKDLHLQQVNEIKLKAKPIELALAHIEPKDLKKKIKVGKHTRPALFGKGSGVVGCQACRYFPNPSPEKHCYLKSFKFYVSNKGSYSAPVRIRIYSVDSKQKPKDDLTHAKIIVAAKKPGSWVKVNLDSLHLPIPEKGLCIAVEYIYSGPEHFWPHKDIQPPTKAKLYGPSLGSFGGKKDVCRRYTFNPITKTHFWMSGKDFEEAINSPLPNNKYVEYLFGIEVSVYE